VQNLQSGEGSTGGRGAQKVLWSILAPDQAAQATIAAVFEGDLNAKEDEPLVFALAAMAGDEPPFRQAMNGTEVPRWRESCQGELDALKITKTYELVIPPAECERHWEYLGVEAKARSR
jgi:hypothetical protein